jgi:uncharacterized protein YkwD
MVALGGAACSAYRTGPENEEAQDVSTASDFERQMLELINQERAAAGLDPLRLELRLNQASEQHSEWMLASDSFSHTGASGSSAGERMEDAGFVFSGSWGWAEDIAWQSERGVAGLADHVANLHAALMNSPGHRANILNPDHEVVGIGIEVGDFNGWNAVMVTQNFAKSAAPMQYDVAPGTTPPAPAPDPNNAPEVELGDLQLAAGSWSGIADRLGYSDADGDAAVRFEIRDSEGGGDVRIDGRVVDASQGYVLDADDLAALEVRAGAAESRDTMEIRAHDGEEWGAWDSFVVEAKPEQNQAPTLAVDDFVLQPRAKASVADHVSVDDPDGDAVQWFQIYDRGSDNFGLGGRTVSADYGRWLTADQFEDLWLRGDAKPSTQTLAIRAHDGEGVSEWALLTLTTDWDLAA